MIHAGFGITRLLDQSQPIDEAPVIGDLYVKAGAGVQLENERP